jgi:hypothetical protein
MLLLYISYMYKVAAGIGSLICILVVFLRLGCSGFFWFVGIVSTVFSFAVEFACSGV